MASPAGKHRIEIPELLWQALNQVAERRDIPTGELAAYWLWEQLQHQVREDSNLSGIHAPRPYDRENARKYKRRTDR